MLFNVPPANFKTFRRVAEMKDCLLHARFLPEVKQKIVTRAFKHFDRRKHASFNTKYIEGKISI